MLGLAFRLSAFFDILPLLIMALFKGRKTTVAFSTGLGVGFFILTLASILFGIKLQDIYFYGFIDNFGSGSTTDHPFLWRTVQFYNLFFYSEIILFYPLVLIYIFVKRKFDWLLLWLTTVFVGINVVGNYARVDMKELLPAMSLIGAFSLAPYAEASQISFKKGMFTIWICFSPRLIEPFINLKHLLTGQFPITSGICHEPFTEPDESDSKQLGLWIKANTKQHEMVYVAGFGSQVQVYSERLSPTIYFNVTQTKLAKQQLYKDLTANRPKLIIIPLFPEYTQFVNKEIRIFIDDLVAKHYRLNRCMYNYNIYELNN